MKLYLIDCDMSFMYNRIEEYDTVLMLPFPVPLSPECNEIALGSFGSSITNLAQRTHLPTARLGETVAVK